MVVAKARVPDECAREGTASHTFRLHNVSRCLPELASVALAHVKAPSVVVAAVQ